MRPCKFIRNILGTFIADKHGGESRDFKTARIADTIEKSIDSGKTFFDISINSDQICTGFKVDAPGKLKAIGPSGLKVIDKQPNFSFARQ